MPRTTVDIEEPVLRKLKQISRERKVPLGRLASELLAKALAAESDDRPRKRRFRWEPIEMGEPRIDLLDKEELWRILDGDEK